RRGEEPAVLEPRGARRTHRPAVDPGRRHTDEQPAIEPRIARPERAVTHVSIEPLHDPTMTSKTRPRSRFPDHVACAGCACRNLYRPAAPQGQTTRREHCNEECTHGSQHGIQQNETG